MLKNLKFTRALQKLKIVDKNYIENKDLLLMGGYTHGQDKDLDDAIAMWPKLIDFISQNSSEKASFDSSRLALLKLYE